MGLPSTKVLKFILEGDGLCNSYTVYTTSTCQWICPRSNVGEHTLGDFGTAEGLLDDDVPS